jgi:GAF domain-containing protein
MQKAPILSEEEKRLCALHELKLLDTKAEERFDSITREAVKRFNVPISTITLLDKDREWYKSVQGLTIKEGPRDTSFCGHAVASEVMMIIEDTLADPRFADNPMVTGTPFVRFYAGKALYDRKSGYPVGVFCIKGIKPRKMSMTEINDFLDLATRAEDEINRPVNC